MFGYLRLGQLVFFGLLTAMTVVAFLPQTEFVDRRLWLGWDKANHVGAYFCITIIARVSFPKWPLYGVMATLMAQGILVEGLQPYFNRTASFGDVAANGMGIMSGLVAYIAWRYGRARLASFGVSDRT